MARSCSAAALLFLLAVLLAAPLHPTAAANTRRPSNPDTTAFGRRAFPKNLTLLGSASILHGRQVAVALTSDGVGAGRALFSEPVRLLLPSADPRAAPAQASFSTRFTFRITPSPTYGDGLAFILTSSRTFLGAADGYMGLYAAAPASAAGDVGNVSTVAVEIDTHLDAALGDSDGNHVALDAGSIISVASASPGLELKAGKPVTAWVVYHAPRRRLRAWVSYSSSRHHVDPSLSVVVDLGKLVNHMMFIGFSASNSQGGAALHVVETWSFRTFWDRKTRQGPPPPPPSPTPPTPSPPLPVVLLATDHHHQLPKIFGVVSLTFVFMVVLGAICVLLLRHRRKTRRLVQLTFISEMTNILPKERSV